MPGSSPKKPVVDHSPPRVFLPLAAEAGAAFQEAKAQWVKRLLLHTKRSTVHRRGRATSSKPVPNVVGIATGEKVSEGRQTGVRSIRFLVQRKIPLKELATKHRLPKTIDGLPTDVQEVGIPRAFACAAPLRTEIRPAQPGSSIGLRNPADATVTTGTFGALVTDGTDFFVLSNNHVLSDIDLLAPGATVFQPSLLDGDDSTGSAIATLTRVFPLSPTGSNRVDCAIAQLTVAFSRDILFIGPPSGPGEPREHMEVHKFGRTTQYSVGRITSIDASVSLRMSNGVDFLFEHQIQIESLSICPFSDDGDSGALILERSSQLAVGLLIGGSGATSFANPLPLVLEKLGGLRLA